MVPVHSLLVRWSPNAPSTKSLQLLSTRSSDPDRLASDPPDVFDLEISQPPTREDWAAGIREAVDASCAAAQAAEKDAAAAVASLGLRLADDGTEQVRNERNFVKSFD